jgi:hypothetical protein
MMMRPDTGPNSPNALAPETLESVRRALQRSMPMVALEPAPELRAALHALATEARAKAVPPEHLLIALKGIWQSLPDVESAREYGDQTRVLQRIVTTCIKEYFAE